MSLLCTSNCRNNCRNNCNSNGNSNSTCNSTCTCNCNTNCNSTCDNSNNTCSCTCTSKCNTPQVEAVPCCCSENQVAGAETEDTENTVMVRALLQTVMDSCCTTEDVCREITLDCPEMFNPDDLCPGSVLNVELSGDISYKEMKRSKTGCTCVSTVRFNIPVRIYGLSSCSGTPYINRTITVVRSVKLCCASDSELTANNTRVLALSAVVTEVCGSQVTFTLCLLFRSCLQQTLLREYTWAAQPVCDTPTCGEARNIITDACDTTCGCTSGARKVCPSC